MGNPASIDGLQATLVAHTLSGIGPNGAITLALNGQREYTLAHDSLNESNVTDTNIIYVATSGLPTGNGQSNSGTVKLIPGRSFTVGPDVPSITFCTTAGAPTFAIVPSRNLRLK